MTLNIPRKVRAALYIFMVLGSPVMAYLLARGIVSDLEVTLWFALTTATAGIAGINLSPEETDGED